MTTFTKALSFVQQRFSHINREESGVPYLCHLMSCVGIVASYGGKATTQTAALLHDCVEEGGVNLTWLEEQFGHDVVNIVGKLTEDKTKPWKERKRAKIKLAESCCQGVGIVMAADAIDTLSSIHREIPLDKFAADRHDDYLRKFHTGEEQQLWFFRQLSFALCKNKRLWSPQEVEYPELNTECANYELLKLTDYITMGREWTLGDELDKLTEYFDS